MQIKLWKNFNKRNNSTKQPADASAVTINATLKAPTSIESPVFTVLGNDTEYNYVNAFGHYYFIDDIIQNTNGTSDIHCTQDELATWKTNIAGYRGFMEYAADSDNIIISDVRNNPTNNWNGAYTPITIEHNPFHATGVYILGVLNDSGFGAVGPVCYYMLDASDMGRFQQAMFSHDFIRNIVQEFTGSASSLVSCIWLPLTDTAMASVTTEGFETVKVGSYSLDSVPGVNAVKGKPLIGRHLTIARQTVNVSFPSVVTFGISERNYLDKAPYSTGVLYLPFVGCVPLDLDIISLDRKFDISADIDVISGDIVYTLYTYAGQITTKYATYSGNIATHLPLSSASYDAMGALSGGISTIGGVVGTVLGATASAASGNYAAAGAAVIGGAFTAAGGALNTAKSFEVHTMVNGSISSAIGAHLGLTPTVMIFTAEPTELNLKAFKAEQGMPVFATETIGSHSGYIKMRDAKISLPSLASDREAVNSYLNSGFFYE